MTIRVLPPLTALDAPRTAAARRLMDAAFEGDFTDDDWQHALGGRHVVAMEGDALVGHAAAVPRRLWVGEEAVEAVYVEAVAVAPGHQGRGVGSALMRALEPVLDAAPLAALSTGEPGFYTRLGWRPWRGPSGVREGGGIRWTPDEDGGLLVRWPAGSAFDVTLPILCLPRVGDDW